MTIEEAVKRVEVLESELNACEEEMMSMERELYGLYEYIDRAKEVGHG